MNRVKESIFIPPGARAWDSFSSISESKDRIVMAKELAKKLARIVGKQHVLADLEGRTCYGYDATNRLFLPDVVVFPGNTEEISEILKLANHLRFPVIPRGAGSGFTGGSLPIHGGVVVSMERLNRILEIDEVDLVAVVEPGVITGDLQRAASSKGLFFPPDPASVDFCSIGGNVAENAGGMRALRYGVTREYVLGLEAVLPNGEILRTGGRTVKNVVGYDLTRLLVGSEGTLGVITQIILKLLPLPGGRGTIQSFFRSVEDATEAVTRIFSARILPSAMEFVDRATLDCVAKVRGLAFPDETQGMLLIEVDGPAGAVQELCLAVEEACKTASPIEIRSSQDPKEAEYLWALRKAISPSLAHIKPHRLNEDIVIPRSRLPEAIERIREISDQHGIQITAFGHAGDGNLHVNVMYDRADDEESSRAEAAAESVMKMAVDLGGSLSGEHGIGVTKSVFLPLEIGPLAREIMRGIKDLLDPHGILNPGKIFPEKSESAG
jgi:glycolate oxidase